MTSQAYKTMVGAFVLGGIGLFALGLVLLAGSRLFSNASSTCSILTAR